MKLKNQCIVLTGATGGIGQELAHGLAKKGAKLVLTGRNIEKLTILKEDLESYGTAVSTIACDVAQPGSDVTLLSQAEATLGGLDMVICNAGVMEFTELDKQSEANITNMIQTNVTSLIQLTRIALTRFKKRNKGHFVFIGSIFGSLGFPHFATYCASKFAIHGFSQALRRELVDTNIQVTYIAPRGVKTAMNKDNTREMFEASGNQLDEPKKVAAKIIEAIEHNKQELFIGQPQSFFAWLNGVAPKLVNIGLKKQTQQAKKYL